MIELPAMPQLELLWRELEVRARGSFFTSWSWIGAWLATYAANATPPSMARLLIARCDARIVAMGIIFRSAQRRMFGAAGNAVLLHQTGQRDDENAFIEYNDFLVDENCAQAARSALLDFVAKDSAFKKGAWAWSEFTIAGADHRMLEAIQSHLLPYRTTRHAVCPWVDLRKFSPDLNLYLASLSANTRAQIRRSIRLAAPSGVVDVVAAQTLIDAKNYLAELRTLHQASWHRREGGLGAFSSPLFASFASTLIDIGYPSGNVDLLRVSAGEQTIGVLLNFVYQNQVYAYQSGFTHDADNRLKPGLVSHALAITHYRQRELHGYHFMAGEQRYKTSLGTATEVLEWIALRRTDARSVLEHVLRSAKAQIIRT